MGDSCPISGKFVDQNVCRVVAALVVLVTVFGAFLRLPVVFFLLMADFLLRGSDYSRYSPLRTLASGFTGVLGVRPDKVDAAPKRFAARIGVVMSAASGALLVAGQPVAASAVAGVLAICAALEAIAGICVGCRMYAMMPAKLAHFVAR